MLRDRGFNYVRLRTWVDPSASDGYASGRPQAWCDLAHTITASQRAKQANMGVLLNIQYSNTWTDPGIQTKPAAWANLSFDALRTQVYDYTKATITALKAAGVTPHMVQVGNEITGGFLFEDGKSYPQSNFTNFANLLKAAITAITEVDASIQIMLHIDRCHNIADSNWWIGSVIDNAVPFTILGQSCYLNTQGQPADWRATFASLTANAKFSRLSFVMAEYSENKREANDVMFGLPNGRGRGTFLFEPTYWLEKLFTQSGNRYDTNSLIELYPQMATAYGL